ncbi:MAG: ParA family protein [Sedimenticola sp.]|nr:ParA family protein [Sedimenticola sp.]
MYRVAIFNPAPGVGKTTLGANLGHALAMAGRKVTLVDLDPVGSLCDSLGLFRPPSHGIDQVILGGVSVESVALSTREELHLVPPGEHLAEIEQADESGSERGRLLRQALTDGIPGTDVLLMDCPSKSEWLVASALLISDLVLVPVTCDEAGALALPGLLETIEQFSRVRGRAIDYRVVINRMPVRRRLTGPAAGFIELAPGRVLKHTICQTDPIAQARSAGRTVFEYRPDSRAAKDFRQLATEWLATVDVS